MIKATYRTASLLTVVLLAILWSMPTAPAQDDSARHRREALRLAIDQFKSNNFENAGMYFEYAKAGQALLNAVEQKELAYFSPQNAFALTRRQEGSTQLRHIEEVFKQGDTAQATSLLSQLNANQFLTTADRQRVTELQRGTSPKPVAPAPAPKLDAKSDAKSLLAAARGALQQGDFAQAEALASQAEKTGSLVPNWITPWSDSPAKLRRDLQAVRDKQQPPAAPVTTTEPEAKDSSWLSVKSWFGKNDKAEPEKKLPEAPPTPMEPSKPAPPNPGSKLMAFWPFGGQASPKKDPAAPEAELSPERKLDEQMARHIIGDGFKHLESGNLDFARQFAMKAKEFNVKFGPNEQTPDALLHEIQRREAKSPSPLSLPPVHGFPVEETPVNPASPISTPPSAPIPGKDFTNADPHTLLREGRAFLQQKKFEEAEKVCMLAQNANARWGLFADTPEKLIRDIQKARQASDRDESVKVMAEARKLFTQGRLDEAQQKADKAAALHGPYGVFDFGDRPQKLLDEIQRARTAKATDDGAKKQPNNLDVLNKTPAGTQNANKNQALAMLTDARKMLAQGQLAEARKKALEAGALKATFLPEEDSPDAVLLSIAAGSEQQIQELLKQAGDTVSSGNDPQRFERAIGFLLMARKLSIESDLDFSRVDQKAVWVQQLAAAAIQRTDASVQPGPAPPPVSNANFNDASASPQQQQAREKLRLAQLELTHGNYTQARRMAEELAQPMYGIVEDAWRLIRSIDAKQYNQRVEDARRTFDAGMDAYARQQHKSAFNLLATIDPQLLSEKHQARLRDIMMSREMQPHQFQLAQHSEMLPRTIEKKSSPQIGDGSPNLLEIVKLKDKVRVEMLQKKGLDAQRTALELFNKAGQKEQAVATLKAYVDYVESEQLDSEKTAMLKRPVENRIQQFKTQIAHETMGALPSQRQYKTWNESKRNEDIKKRQDEMVLLMKQGMELYKKGKLKESEEIARKVLAIDRENVAALQLLMQSQTLYNQRKHDESTRNNQDIFLKLGDTSLGAIPDLEKGISIDPKTARRERSGGEIWGRLSNPKERAIESRLLQPISLHLKNVPLSQAIETLKIESGLQIAPDLRSLKDAGIDLSAPLTVSVEKISMKSALNIMLKPARLTYTIENEVLVITTEERRTTQLKRVTYPVGDLVNLPQSHKMPDVLDPIKGLERLLTPQQALYGAYPMPLAGYPSYSGGVPVSPTSTSAGLGSAFGSNSSQSPGHGSPDLAPRDRSPEAMAALLKGLIMNVVSKHSWEELGGQGTIQYFPMGMALVINQQQEVQESIMELLASLRKLQDLQVAVELRAVLVSETFFERIGMDFDMNIRTPTSRREPDLLNGTFVVSPFLNRNVDKLGGLISGLTPAGTLTPDLNIPLRNSTFNFTTPQFGGYQPEAGLSLGLAFLSDIQVFMFLEAVQGDRRAHIMQAPKLTVYNGETAFIAGSVARPQVTGLTPTAASNGTVIMVPTMSAIPTGLGMTVTPVVSPDRRFVRLNLQPQVTQPFLDPAAAEVRAFPSNFSTGIPPVPLPNTPLNVTIAPQPVQLQIIQTTVNVPDGGTVLLGGFKFLAEERTEYGPPVLSKIPYLSRLFRNTGWSRDGATLLYLVTARVIMVEEEENIFLGIQAPIPRP